MSELRLEAGGSSVVVDADNGGRLTSLQIEGYELLVIEAALGGLQWGSYPMVPWAGRVREGIFEFGGIAYELPRNLSPHSAHGVGFTTAWSVVDSTTLACDLGTPWPFGGRATQQFELSPSELLITMTVAADQDMPVMMGWHPWFSRYLVTRSDSKSATDSGADSDTDSDTESEPVEAVLSFGQPAMYELDDSAIPTGQLVAMPPGPWDNCFLAPEQRPRITWPGAVELELASSCDHWVVYTEPDHALCVEPQTDAPDVFNRSPTILRAGESTTEWFRLRWG